MTEAVLDRDAAARVAVIGAGSSGLAVMKALLRRNIPAICFERGSDVGGGWRYNNDSGLSSAYESLRTNVSRRRMEYPSFPMPDEYGDFPHHSQMAQYLGAYADEFDLRRRIRCRATVAQLDPDPEGAWNLSFADGSTTRYPIVVIAVGHFWLPKVPDYPGIFSGDQIHSHEYRTPKAFADKHVLVVGGGQSAAEIACEVSAVAAHTYLSIRHLPHVVPRWIGGLSYDRSDVNPLNRLPWPVMNAMFRRAVRRELGTLTSGWHPHNTRILEGIPIISSDLLPAIERRDISVKPAVDHIDRDRAFFVDGSNERVDCLIYATGYRISLPFASGLVLATGDREIPLYRRIVPPEYASLFFAGFVDAPGGLLPVVEAQGEWIADVIEGSIRLPSRNDMLRTITRSERRTRQRFPDAGAFSLRCDPHAYRRLLLGDLRRTRRKRHYKTFTAATKLLRSDVSARMRSHRWLPRGTR